MEDGKLQNSNPGNKRNPKVAFLHAHDSKQLKVEVFSGQHEVYQQFFKKEFARIVSKLQIGMGIASVAAQIATVSMLPDSWSGYNGTNTPIWTSIISMIAAVFVIMCCHKTTYVRLHLAMAFHLLAILGMLFLSIEGFCGVIPSLKRQLYNGNGNNYYYNNYNHQYDINENATAPYYAPKYNNYQYYNSRPDELRSTKVMAVSLFFVSMITFLGLAQMFLSFVMSMMTGRAMCAGRSKLEGKIFAMEILGREDKDLSAVICSNQVSQHDIPPPYSNVSLGHSEA